MNNQPELITICGLCCLLCAERARIPRRAAALRRAMVEEGWSFWAHTTPGFTEFWDYLDGLAGGGCSGCRAGGGPPECQIRLCAQERGVKICVACADYPCAHIEALGTIYPTLIADGRRLQEIGPERWLSEQQERARRGVVYADLRHPVDQDAGQQPPEGNPEEKG